MDRSPLEEPPAEAQTRLPVPVMADDELVALFKHAMGRTCGHVATLLSSASTWIPVLGSSRSRYAPGRPGLVLGLIRVRGKGDKHRAIPFGARTGQALSRY